MSGGCLTCQNSSIMHRWSTLDPFLQATWLPDGDGGDYEFVIGLVEGNEEDLHLVLGDFDIIDDQGVLVEKGLHCRVVGNLVNVLCRSLSVESWEQAELEEAVLELQNLVVDQQEALQTAGASSSSWAPGFMQVPVVFLSVEEVFGECLG